MNSTLSTYGQLRNALLERYEHAPLLIAASDLETHLEDRVFRPLQLLLNRIDRLDQILTCIVTNSALSPADKTQFVSEFQDTIE